MCKRRAIKTIIILIVLLVSFIGFANKAFLYDGETTHYNLTKEMIRLYNLAYDPDITDDTVRLILQGSIDEDVLPRPAFHLYDPVYNRAPFGAYTAMQWAVNSDVQGSTIHKFANLFLNLFGTSEFKQHGDYSWTANINNYAKNKQNQAWYGLGHILHLVEDMAVPAHSRNDHHLNGDPFEVWLKQNAKQEDYWYAEKLYQNGYWPADVDFLSQAMNDLAKYSNKYFFSKDSLIDTNLGKQYNSPQIIIEKEEDWGKYVQRMYAWGKDEEGKMFRLAKVKTLESAWRDATPTIKEKMAYEILDDDYNLHRDYFQRLAPKAIQYGAGIIRLFIADAEFEARIVSQQKNPSQSAQVYTPLPDIKPSKLPESLTIVIPPVESPSTVPLNNPSETPNNQGEDKGNQNENQGEVKGEQSEDKGTVVSDPIIGGDGGLSPGIIEQMNNPPSEPEQTSSISEPLPPPPIPPIIRPHLIINEVQIKNNEFIELYNPTALPISLASYSFCYFSKARDWNNPDHHKEFPEAASISAGGYYLIGLEGYPNIDGNPDADWQPYSSKQLSNSDGSIAIFPFDPTTKTASESRAGAIDAVAWGDVDFVKEGTEFQTELGIDKSMQRIGSPPIGEAGQDNDDNNTDFELKTIPMPTNSNNQQRINGTVVPDTTIISTDTTWTIAGSPYYIESNAGKWPIVESGATLTIEPGVIIMPQNADYTFLEIRGTLKAEGTASDKIVFTSKNDSSYGSSGPAAPGDFKNIVFTSTSTNSVLDYVLFSYGGKNAEMIKIDGSQIEINNSIIENSFKNGVYLNNSNSEIKNTEIKNNSGTGIVVEGTESAPEISDCQINDNIQYGIEIKNGASPTIKDNSFSGNQVAAVYLKNAYPEFNNNQTTNNALNGIVVDSQTIIDQDTTWNADMVYILKSNLGQYVIVNEGRTLILEPGTIIKPYSPYYTPLLINGALNAEGVLGNEIVFTSINDDLFGGDTNNDGNTTMPADGDWKKIKFETTSTGLLDYVFMYYGTGVPPMEMVGSASVEIKDTVDYTP